MWHSDSCQRACYKHCFCQWELAGLRCFSVTLAATASWLPGLGLTVGGLGEAREPMSPRPCGPTASCRRSTSGCVTDQGSWPDPINRSWQEARQEMQARLYWGVCYSRGEREQTTGSPPAAWGEVSLFPIWGEGGGGSRNWSGWRGLPSGLPTPLVELSAGGRCSALLLLRTLCFCFRLLRSGSWVFWSLCIFWIQNVPQLCTCPWGRRQSGTTECLSMHALACTCCF